MHKRAKGHHGFGLRSGAQDLRGLIHMPCGKRSDGGADMPRFLIRAHPAQQGEYFRRFGMTTATDAQKADFRQKPQIIRRDVEGHRNPSPGIMSRHSKGRF